MKFKCSVTIQAERSKVVELFADPANLKEYQDGFLGKDLVSGEAGQTGAVSMMYYQMGKKKMELEETIVLNDLPDQFHGSYHHKHMDNTMKSTFEDLGNGKTQYDAEIEYTAFRGLMPKLMARLFPGLFKKQVQKWLNNFKAFAEKQD